MRDGVIPASTSRGWNGLTLFFFVCFRVAMFVPPLFNILSFFLFFLFAPCKAHPETYVQGTVSFSSSSLFLSLELLCPGLRSLWHFYGALITSSLSLSLSSAIIVILHWLLFWDCQKSNPMSSVLSLANVPSFAQTTHSRLNHRSATSAL